MYEYDERVITNYDNENPDYIFLVNKVNKDNNSFMML